MAGNLSSSSATTFWFPKPAHSSAISTGTMTQLYGSGESECSVIMLWTYALASVSLTLWSTFFLRFVG